MIDDSGAVEAASILLARSIDEHLLVLSDLLAEVREPFERSANLLLEAVRNDRAIFFAGNGGSASDAMHLAAELVGRFQRERPGLRSEALSANPASLTAISNDYGFAQSYSRLVQANARAGDVLVAISTSGSSVNILAAAAQARRQGVHVIGLSGAAASGLAHPMQDAVDILLMVPSRVTARVQEMHILLGHCWCDWIERHCVQ